MTNEEKKTITFGPGRVFASVVASSTSWSLPGRSRLSHGSNIQHSWTTSISFVSSTFDAWRDRWLGVTLPFQVPSSHEPGPPELTGRMPQLICASTVAGSKLFSRCEPMIVQCYEVQSVCHEQSYLKFYLNLNTKRITSKHSKQIWTGRIWYASRNWRLGQPEVN